MRFSSIEESKENPRTIWKLFRKFGASCKKQPTENIIGVKVNGHFISNEKKIADIFNTYFVNAASNLKEPLQISAFENLRKFVTSNVLTYFDNPVINVGFVKMYLPSLDTTKSTGLDCIGPKFLKLALDILASSITFLINKSITTGNFPNMWKHARVSPVFKTGSKDEMNNYRPISVLPTLSKLIEKWINIKLSAFLNNHELLHNTQSGFREGYSTESALILMLDTWLKAVNEGRLVGSVMIDFRKAFDMVDHEILLKKLNLYRCSSLTVSWFRRYLSNRSQTVSINGVNSESDTVLCGVPQGSILGPLLFLLFINDLPLTLKNVVSATDLYADDTTIYDVQTDKAVLSANLQTALNLLKTWCRENGMLLNTDKTKVMLLTSRQKRTLFTGNFIVKL